MPALSELIALLVAEPEVFLAKLSGPGIEFVVNGLPDKYTLEIDFRPQGNVKGPFVRTAGVRGRYDFVGTGQSVKAQSGGVDTKQVKAGSYWKYEVVVRDAERNDKAAIDPGGVFK